MADHEQTESVPSLLSTGTVIKLHSFRILCTEGPDQGKAWSLDRPSVAIGSGSDADVQLSDPAVSRRHIIVELGPRGWSVKDQESRNGTLLDGVAVQAAFLRSGSKIRIGRSELSFVPREQSVIAQPSSADRFRGVLGGSPAMQKIFGVLERVAPLNATIVLTGPTGAGKGALARAIHEASPRGKGPFAVLDCGNLDTNLISSELFGHTRGAFTGATEARAGVFESACGGTVFIDEIGELPLELQPKLLRALDERRITRLGSQTTVPLDVRVIAATHRDLRAMASAGRFREDLLYRLAVVEIEVPPLAHRKEDVALLTRHFLDALGEGARWPVADAALARLCAHAWPGNVRELRNVVERAVALAGPDRLGAEHVQLSPVSASAGAAATPAAHAPANATQAAGAPDSAAAAEREVYARVLAKHGGNRTHAAHELGVAVTTLKRKMKKYGLE